MSRIAVLMVAVAGCVGLPACGGSDNASTNTAGTTPSVPTGTTTQARTDSGATAPGGGTDTGATTVAGGEETTAPGTGTAGGSATVGGASGPRAGSRTKQEIALKSGGKLSYTLVLPTTYRPGGAKHPILLALPPGGQGQEEVDALLDKWWAPEAVRRGWIVVSPVAPDGQLFFSGSSGALLELMDAVAATYPPEGAKFHLAGVSNGGLSAYRIALDAPRRFASLLVAPGFPPEAADRAKLKRLVKIPVASYVGEQDSGWREASVRTVRELTRLGGRATLTVSAGEGHILQKITAKQLFDVLDATRPQR